MVKYSIVALFLVGVFLVNVVCVGIVLVPFLWFDFRLAVVVAAAITWPAACILWFCIWLTTKNWVHS